MTSTIVLILVALNLVLLVVGLVAWRLFRADPNPTVSDPLGVPRVARVSGIVGTLSDNSGGSQPNTAKSVIAAAAPASATAVASCSAPATITRHVDPNSTGSETVTAVASSSSPDDLDLPGLFAVDTGASSTPTSATAG